MNGHDIWIESKHKEDATTPTQTNNVILSAAVVAFFGLNVLLSTLELNDFRHRLKMFLSGCHSSDNPTTTAVASDDSNDNNNESNDANDSDNNSDNNGDGQDEPTKQIQKQKQLLAVMVALRLGSRDATFDWLFLHSALYSVVAGLTWSDMDPNALAILNGLGLLVASFLLFLLSLKIPLWLGHYKKSRFQLLDDVSNLAKQLTSTHSATSTSALPSLQKIRSTIRFGIGKQISKSIFLILPFYCALKVWAYLASILIGVGLGYLYLYCVFTFRQRYRQKNQRRLVVTCASGSLSLLSAVICFAGLQYINLVWGWSFASSRGVLFIVSFSTSLAVSVIFHAIEYCLQLKQSGMGLMGGNSLLFDEEDLAGCGTSNNGDGSDDDNDDDDDDDANGRMEEGQDLLAAISEEYELSEPLVNQEGRRCVMKKSKNQPNHSSGPPSRTTNIWYQTGYFDPSAIHDRPRTEHVLTDEASSDTATMKSAYEIYVELNEVEEMATTNGGDNNVQVWKGTCQRIWHRLPFYAAYKVFLIHLRDFCCCCPSRNNDSSNNSNEDLFATRSLGYKLSVTLTRIGAVLLNCAACYLALVACIATLQIQSTKQKLPAVNEQLYVHMDQGPVCAFDHKDGHIQIFPDKQAADDANYTIAHCGECGHCSNWIDLELEYSTRDNLAHLSQQCGIQTLGKGTSALQKCLEGPTIGFTPQCARCWAEDIVCTKKHCMFIFLQSQMTNQVGNFAVGPNSITSATCEEAHCEAEPDQFVPCSGATRRRMNITSSIQRPGTQRCEIVGVKDWGEFFYPT